MLSDKNAVSEIVGYIILVSIVVTVIGIIYVVLMPDIFNSQDQAQFQNIEQSFTVLDTHTSKAQYSNYLSQMTEMDLKGGKLTVNSSQSNITIKFYDGTTIYSGSLGTIDYDLDGREIGYEGGGIWEKYSDGGSIMISAPDFNYNGVTLTLPLMQIQGNGTVAGTGKAFITTKSQTTPNIIYPNSSINRNATNHVTADQVYIIIKSEYYKAWADYINKRTDAAAITYPNKTCVVTFNTKLPGVTRDFVPPIKIRGLNTSNPHPITKFNLNLTKNSPDIESINFDLRAPQSNSPIPGPSPALHINIQKKSGGGTSGLQLMIEYTDNNKVEKFSVDPWIIINHGAKTANMSLLDDYSYMTYTSSDDSWSWGATTYHNGDTVTVHDVVEHYLILMAQKTPGGSFNLNYGNYHNDHTNDNQHPDVPSSTYTLDYDSINVLTYMHVTNNPIKVTLG
jgi:type II secretory pathway pseudopilin PulG